MESTHAARLRLAATRAVAHRSTSLIPRCAGGTASVASAVRHRSNIGCARGSGAAPPPSLISMPAAPLDPAAPESSGAFSFSGAMASPAPPPATAHPLPSAAPASAGGAGGGGGGGIGMPTTFRRSTSIDDLILRSSGDSVL